MRLSTKILLLCLLTIAVVISTACEQASLPIVTVYKTATCGCCKAWVNHLRDSGLEVRAIDVANLRQIKAENDVPEALASCHTALVDGYVVEGHVPAEDILRLLEERPSVAGLGVPGMPIGSPGMEGPNPERYVVYSFDAEGTTSPFASHGP